MHSGRGKISKDEALFGRNLFSSHQPLLGTYASLADKESAILGPLWLWFEIRYLRKVERSNSF